jgi:hypothetical protein
MLDLKNELEFVRTNPPASPAEDTLVGAPIKPRPHINSGHAVPPE